jgi:hypothetical protein
MANRDRPEGLWHLPKPILYLLIVVAGSIAPLLLVSMEREGDFALAALSAGTVSANCSRTAFTRPTTASRARDQVPARLGYATV